VSTHTSMFHKRFQALLIQQDLDSTRLAETVEVLTTQYAEFVLRITVNPTQTAETVRLADPEKFSIGTVIGYPLGNLHQQIKAVQMEAASQAGADHVDILLPIEHLLDGKEEKAAHEVQELTNLSRDLGLTSAWVANLAFLNKEQRSQAAALISQAGTPMVTNTGFNNKTTLMDLTDVLAACDSLPVTVCGGIESAKEAVAFLTQGAQIVSSHNPSDLLAGLRTLLAFSEDLP